jgi:hypothetical protein
LQAAGLAAMGGVSTGAYATLVEPHWVEVTHHAMPIRNLPAGLAGKRLVQISDLHIGPVVSDEYLTEAMGRVASLKPDLLVITGDFVTFHGTDPLGKASGLLKCLPQAPLGNYAIFGNHDYTESWTNAYHADRLARRVRQSGIQLLRNQSANVGGLRIVGLEDLWSPFWTPTPLMSRLDPEEPKVVLCHNPDAADHAIWEHHQGWILSGHTHGGQCCFPFIGAPRLPVQNRDYVSGAYKLANGCTMYINRGLGHSLPVRFGVRPEITVFTLQSA